MRRSARRAASLASAAWDTLRSRNAEVPAVPAAADDVDEVDHDDEEVVHE